MPKTLIASKFNGVLAGFERAIKREADNEIPALDALAREGLLIDYEFEAFVYPFSADGGVMGHEHVDLKRRDLIDDGGDWSDASPWRGRFKHCRLFHSFYDHENLGHQSFGWKEMRRISGVWLNFVVKRQRRFDLSGPFTLSKLNRLMMNAERWTREEFDRAESWADAKVGQPGYLSPRYEISCDVEAYTGPDSTATGLCDGDPLVSLRNVDKTRLCDGKNHNPCRSLKNHPPHGQRHCHLMARLFSKLSSQLSPHLGHLRLIDDIWVDMNISFGSFQHLRQ